MYIFKNELVSDSYLLYYSNTKRLASSKFLTSLAVVGYASLCVSQMGNHSPRPVALGRWRFTAATNDLNSSVSTGLPVQSVGGTTLQTPSSYGFSGKGLAVSNFSPSAPSGFHFGVAVPPQSRGLQIRGLIKPSTGNSKWIRIDYKRGQDAWIDGTPFQFVGGSEVGPFQWRPIRQQYLSEVFNTATDVSIRIVAVKNPNTQQMEGIGGVFNPNASICLDDVRVELRPRLAGFKVIEGSTPYLYSEQLRLSQNGDSASLDFLDLTPESQG
jgi:hypothetical protein